MDAPHQRPPQPRPPLSPVSVHGRKRALLCGVNYHGKSYKLKGSINDVKCMRYLLVEKLGFPNDSILMLTGDVPYFFLSTLFLVIHGGVRLISLVDNDKKSWSGKAQLQARDSS